MMFNDNRFCVEDPLGHKLLCNEKKSFFVGNSPSGK